jgi:hypothetical protein
MSIQHAMNIGPAKINELFGRLGDTTDGATRKREAVFGELTAEINLVAELEEKHLLPLLAKHEETKAVVAAAREDNEAIRRQLEELSRMPKVGDAFTQGVASLRKAFQRSVRDDRKELLPAVRSVLSREEVDAVAERMQTGAAEAEQARRDEASQAKDDAKVAREEARREAKAVQAADRTREAAEQASREAAKQAASTIREASDALADAARDGAGRMADGARRATASIGEATSIYRDVATGAAGDIQAVVSASGVAARAAADVRRHWNEHIAAALQDGIALSQRLMRCRTGSDVAEAQRDYARAATHAWLASQVRILEATQRAAAEALPALQARLADEPEARRDRGTVPTGR